MSNSPKILRKLPITLKVKKQFEFYELYPHNKIHNFLSDRSNYKKSFRIKSKLLSEITSKFNKNRCIEKSLPIKVVSIPRFQTKLSKNVCFTYLKSSQFINFGVLGNNVSPRDEKFKTFTNFKKNIEKIPKIQEEMKKQVKKAEFIKKNKKITKSKTEKVIGRIKIKIDEEYDNTGWEI